MTSPKNILEATVFTRLFLFLVLVTGLFFVLFTFTPSPNKDAYVAESEFVKPYQGRQVARKTTKKVEVTDKNYVVKKVDTSKKESNGTKFAKKTQPADLKAPKIAKNESSDKVLQKAIAHVDSGEYQLARSLIEEALEKDPNNEQLLVELGMIYLIDFRQPEGALPHLEKALKVNPSNKVVLSELVGIYQEIGQSDAGLDFMRNLLGSNPGNSELNLGVGQILLSDNKTFEATKYLEDAIKSGAQPDYVYTDLAEAYSRTGRPDKAIKTYEAAVSKAQNAVNQNTDPNFKDLNEDILDRSLLNLARELRKNGRQKEAEDKILSILKRRPQHQEALYQLGKIHKNKG
jgi:tetratricopeptide (TPR) repeat protein